MTARTIALRMGMLAGAVVASFLVFVTVGGSLALPVDQVLRELFRGPVALGEPANSVVWAVRLPRACASMTAGAILGVCGAAFQSLFRNPMAEPFVTGVSSGAAVGGTLGFLLGMTSSLQTLGLSFAGGLASLVLVIGLAGAGVSRDVRTLLVAGVVVASMLSGLSTLNLYLAGQDSNQVLRWLLGSTTPMSWDRISVMAIALFAGTAALLLQARRLNALSVDEFMAARLGVDTNRLKWTVMLVTTVMVAACVGSVGIIGFLGLLAPHIARRLTKADNRVSIPASALVGAVLLLASDIVAQKTKPGMELPLGAVTAIIGAPMLLWLLRAEKKGYSFR